MSAFVTVAITVIAIYHWKTVLSIVIPAASLYVFGAMFGDVFKIIGIVAGLIVSIIIIFVNKNNSRKNKVMLAKERCHHISIKNKEVFVLSLNDMYAGYENINIFEKKQLIKHESQSDIMPLRFYSLLAVTMVVSPYVVIITAFIVYTEYSNTILSYSPNISDGGETWLLVVLAIILKMLSILWGIVINTAAPYLLASYVLCVLGTYYLIMLEPIINKYIKIVVILSFITLTLALSIIYLNK